ncbi:MAG: hypothetical protein AAFY98_09555 [Verrucomicrobiota bacterium]
MSEKMNEIAADLERRSAECPGLYLLSDKNDFILLAKMQQPHHQQAILARLEQYQQTPNTCLQDINHRLCSQNAFPLRGSGPARDDREFMKEAIQKALKSPCKTESKSAA